MVVAELSLPMELDVLVYVLEQLQLFLRQNIALLYELAQNFSSVYIDTKSSYETDFSSVQFVFLIFIIIIIKKSNLKK